MTKYTYIIFYSEEDEGYIADVPDLKYCSAFGATPEQALKEVTKAKQAWLETAKASNKPIPLPLYRPVSYQEYAAAMMKQDITISAEHQSH
jgi:predicted RNase H-like HicB family nuclease